MVDEAGQATAGGTRIEHDTLGEVAVPVDALYGAQTQRAVENFPVSGLRLGRDLIWALGTVKAAACLVNAELGVLDTETAAAIEAAAGEVAAGEHDDHFPVDVFQTGSGTSSNMNANEVIAHLAGRRLGRAVHPNDAVNASQSSNDTFPTAIHLAAARAVTQDLQPALAHLARTLRARAEDNAGVIKAGRTHLMDATPVTLGQELSGYATQVERGVDRLSDALPRLCELPLGGTAVGTGINAPAGFAERVVAVLGERTGLHLTEAVDHFEAASARDGLVETSGALRTVAVGLTKICNDLRWMSSGPATGLAEIHLPDLQPGSSIMPGKVNPVVPEAVLQVCARVIGNDVTVAWAGASGSFELNVMMPVTAHALLESIRLLTTGTTLLADRCVAGLTADAERCLRLAQSSPAVVTPLARLIGYERAAQIAKHAIERGLTIRESTVDLGLLERGELSPGATGLRARHLIDDLSGGAGTRPGALRSRLRFLIVTPTPPLATGSEPAAANSARSSEACADPRLWWREAVTYQLYIRSFADSDGDGLGDVDGIRSRLPYLAELGVDAVWINPWYPSPQADGGYDVSDYRQIEPCFGTLEQADALIGEAHALGLKVILDIVPNHTSDEHDWFVHAVAAGPGSPERDRFFFRTGRGPDGEEPPNDWLSVFGGRAWTRIIEPDGRPGQWYLHLFDPKQPDLNWDDPTVRVEFEDILRYWFDRGADGFRIDVAHGLIKDPALPDLDGRSSLAHGEPHLLDAVARFDHPHWDRPGVHDIYRSWRAVAETYDPPKVFVAEAWVADQEQLAAYLRSDELHTAFDFHFVQAPWNAADLRRTAAASLAAHERVGAPVMWVLSNHDITRHVTRLGRPDARTAKDPLHAVRTVPNLDLGRRRARAALLLELALPGGVYLYQGEELGLEEVENLPEELLQDPAWRRSGHTVRGRDGCRVPLPWSTSGPSLGFGDGGGWLPQPAAWAGERGLSAQAQTADPDSMLTLYRTALRRRAELVGSRILGADPALTWLEELSSEDVLAFHRGPDGAGMLCLVNTGAHPVALPAGEVLLTSGPLNDGEDDGERRRRGRADPARRHSRVAGGLSQSPDRSRPATCPMTITAGGRTFSRWATATMSPSSARTTR